MKFVFVLLHVTMGIHLTCCCGIRCSRLSLSLSLSGGCVGGRLISSRLLVQEKVMGVAVLIRAVTMLAGKCGFVGRGAAGVSGRRLCQASGGWVLKK